MKAKEAIGASLVALLVVGGGGYLIADAADVVPGVLTNASPHATPSPFPTLAPVTPSPISTSGAAPDDAAAQPATASLQQIAQGVFSTAGGAGLDATGVSVTDIETGKQLLAMADTASLTPASTTKLFTAAAAISQLGAATTIKTQVVTGADDGHVVLVGGGDMMLGPGAGAETVEGRAGLGDLAKATAEALRARGVSSVALQLDDTLFEGPRTAITWPGNYVPDGVVAPITPLAVDLAKVKHDSAVPRQEDPALAAAQSFAKLLAKQGIRVTGTSRASAPAGAKELAAVESAPISELAAFMLQYSENTLAEVLGKLVALHRSDPTGFQTAARAVTQSVADLGADTGGVELLDCSGLSRDSKVTARSLTSLLTVGYAKPEVRGLFSGLPIGGLNGTLARRFHEDGDGAAVGTVRAKTGTLTGVHSMAGVVQDADGRALAFAVLVTERPNRTLTVSSETLIDQFVADLADCGCRG